MTDLTIWPARLVGEEYRCGHVVNGRQRCPGVIAWVDDILPNKRARYEPGTLVHELPDKPGGVLHLRNTTRTRKRRTAPESWVMWPVAEFPFTRSCPVCNCTVLVDSAMR